MERKVEGDRGVRQEYVKPRRTSPTEKQDIIWVTHVTSAHFRLTRAAFRSLRVLFRPSSAGALIVLALALIFVLLSLVIVIPALSTRCTICPPCDASRILIHAAVAGALLLLLLVIVIVLKGQGGKWIGCRLWIIVAELGVDGKAGGGVW